MLLTLLSFTQTNYPILLINNGGDSLVVQTLEQTRWVSEQVEIGKSCALSSTAKDSIIVRLGNNEKTLKGVIDVKNEIIASKDSTINDKGTIINTYQKINTDLKKENKHLKLKNTFVWIGGAIITTATVIFFLLVK